MTPSIVIMTEEPSARIVIEEIGRRIALNTVQVLQHSGRSDLERSINRKINGWKSPYPTRFIVMRDLDHGDRDILKARLLQLIPDHAKIRSKIRIVIPELESWYLGDPNALVQAGLLSTSSASKTRTGARFRNLCALRGAKEEFKRSVGEIGQISAARAIAPHMSTTTNNSRNFIAFAEALRWADTEISREEANPVS